MRDINWDALLAGDELCIVLNGCRLVEHGCAIRHIWVWDIGFVVSASMGGRRDHQKQRRDSDRPISRPSPHRHPVSPFSR
jgi:hypothetical protein